MSLIIRMNILITGVAGFIGSHLSEKLLSLGHQIVGVDNFDPFYPKETKEKNLKGSFDYNAFSFYEIDIVDKNQFNLIKSNFTFDLIIHLAAKPGVTPSLLDKRGFINTNIIGTQNVLDYAADSGVKKVIFASSSSIYGNNSKVPFSENDVTDTPISTYAFTKKSCELLMYNYHHLFDINSINFRFFTVYGPRQRPDLAIHKFFNLIKQGEEISLYGDGSSSRDYTFVSDIVDGLVRGVDYINQRREVCLFDTINLGNNSPIKLNVLVELIQEVIGKKAQVTYQPMRDGEVDTTFADIEKARKLLGYDPSTSIKQGLIAFNNWHEFN